MAKLVKLNIQTTLGGVLLGCGKHNLENIPQSGLITIEQYINEQKLLPLEERDLPPYFEIITLDEDGHVVKEEVAPEDKYIGLKNDELKEECKKRGIDIKGLRSNAELINALKLYDENGGSEDSCEKLGFLSTEDFLALSSEKQVEYLDEKFCLPEGVEEDSEEAVQYSEDLKTVVNVYAGLSLEDETVEKVKEIIDYYAEEE